LEQSIQKLIPNNQSEVRAIGYENDESIKKDLQDDKDLLEIANTREYYKFFKDIDIEDFNHIKRLEGISDLE